MLQTTQLQLQRSRAFDTGPWSFGTSILHAICDTSWQASLEQDIGLCCRHASQSTGPELHCIRLLVQQAS